ncbi:MAG: hypothetical protein J6A79_03185 [Clostridia bacterium]|nr:hypothetical protein [Clostridia bacterium]
MKKKAAAQFLWILACLLLLLSAAVAETRQGTIALEGMEETIGETLYQSPQGFSFWYADESFSVRSEKTDGAERVIVCAVYTGESMALTKIPEEEASELTESLGMDIAEQSAASRVQIDLYRELEGTSFRFSTLIAENGEYLQASGEYSMESAEGM